MNKLKFGVFLPFYAFKTSTQPASLFSRLLDTVKECERLEYDSVWIDDHLMSGNLPILECWTTLSALASATSRIRLGTMVTSNAFRNPGLLAKMGATLDVISNGRLELGLGAGIQREEHEAYGFPFPDLKSRAERLGESIEIIKALWTQTKATFSGKYVKVANASCEPKPIQKPHPPVTIGGCGENHLLKITAKHADRFDFGYILTINEYKKKMQVLKTHCESIGRNCDEIEKSCWPAGQILLDQNAKAVEEQIQRFKPKNMSVTEWKKFTFTGTAEDFMSILQPYLTLRVTNFVLFFGDLPEIGSLRLFSDAIKKTAADART